MVDATRQRDRFIELLDRHHGIVFKVAHAYCWHPDDRADVRQEILAETWRAFPSYDAARPFATWLYRIALNVAISAGRRRRYRDRHTIPFDDEQHDAHAAPAAPDPVADERIRELYRVIGQLDELNRALVLLYLDEHTHREMAEILGISETNVATKLSRLKARLRAEMAAAS